MNKTALTVKANPPGIIRVIQCEVDIHPFPFSTKSEKVNAIWDTGATGCAITKKVVKSLGLQPTGMVQVHTANGIGNQNTFEIGLKLPGEFLIQGITATEVDALSGDCDALIGMDVINLGDFSITNLDGITCMSFRIPSQKEIDFVKEHNIAQAIIQRHFNAGLKEKSKCSCNSGKQFNNCHGKYM